MGPLPQGGRVSVCATRGNGAAASGARQHGRTVCPRQSTSTAHAIVLALWHAIVHDAVHDRHRGTLYQLSISGMS
eukprot:scaffold51988_cov59-Phaeocystis_antarctica.AAC.2